MPQPFKRKGRQVRLSPSVIVENPQFAIDIGNIASHWSKLEFTLGLMYTYVLLGQEPSAFEFYYNLIDLNLRKQALLSAAKDKLSDDLIAEIESIFAEVRKLAKARNDVVHANWASIPTKPDSILLSNPKDVGVKINELFRHLARLAKNPESSPTTASVDLAPDTFVRYTHADFNDIVKRIIALDEKATSTANKVLAQALKFVKGHPKL